MLDLRQFQVLRAIASSGSLVGAARELHYGQPTISYHLGALEAHLGAKLVERSPTGAVLTDLGTMVLEHAGAVLDRIDAVEADVEARMKHGVSTLRIGAFRSAASRLLPQAVRDAAIGSDVRLDLLEAEPLDLIAHIRAGSLHCAVIYDIGGGRAGYGADMRAETLFDDPYRVLLPASHPQARAVGPVDIELLADDGWIVSRGSYDPSDQTLFATCQSLGFRPRTVLRTDDYGVLHGFVAAGTAVALVPELALEEGYDVVVRPAVQMLGSRSVRFLAPRGTQPALVGRLREELHRAAAARTTR